jgi:hypothetical protein
MHFEDKFVELTEDERQRYFDAELWLTDKEENMILFFTTTNIWFVYWLRRC